jgi:hypothetical protein
MRSILTIGSTRRPYSAGCPLWRPPGSRPFVRMRLVSLVIGTILLLAAATFLLSRATPWMGSVSLVGEHLQLMHIRAKARLGDPSSVSWEGAEFTIANLVWEERDGDLVLTIIFGFDSSRSRWALSQLLPIRLVFLDSDGCTIDSQSVILWLDHDFICGRRSVVTQRCKVDAPTRAKLITAQLGLSPLSTKAIELPRKGDCIERR